MKEQPALEIIDVHKSFDRRMINGGYTTFKTQLVQWLAGDRHEHVRRQRLHVLKGLNFTIDAGETVGIIGRNGAGKSTLLKLLTGIYKPNEGSVRRHGRISALLELGAGFHPEFSGRENIVMNGMILGMTRKELRDREQAIIDFAELHDFIDAPVRTYSSGMYMRLAFAVAVNVDPQILLIDEILGVGDEHFAHKSKAKLDEFKTKRRAIVLVTHSLNTVEEWCTRAIWLHDGKVAADGEPRWVVNQYRRHVAQVEQRQVDSIAKMTPGDPNRWGSEPGVIESFKTATLDGSVVSTFEAGTPFRVEVRLAQPPRPGQKIGFGVFTSEGVSLVTSAVESDSGRQVYQCSVDGLPVNARYARVDVFVTAADGDVDYWRDAARLDFRGQSQGGLVVTGAAWHE